MRTNQNQLNCLEPLSILEFVNNSAKQFVDFYLVYFDPSAGFFIQQITKTWGGGSQTRRISLSGSSTRRTSRSTHVTPSSNSINTAKLSSHRSSRTSSTWTKRTKTLWVSSSLTSDRRTQRSTNSSRTSRSTSRYTTSPRTLRSS